MPDNIRVYSAGPMTLVALLVIIGLVVIVVPLLFLGLAGKAFTHLVGLSWLTATALVILILLCSLVNIPVWKVRKETIRMPHGAADQFPEAFTPGGNGGFWETSITVNLGGAVIPVAMACWLLYRASAVMGGETLYLQVAAATLIVAAIAYVLTRPMVGIGLRAPLFVPGIAALLCGILFAQGLGLSAGVIAFFSTTFGILLGSGIAHLPEVGDLEVSQVSIGGSGMFGAIFIGCILSALIA